MNKLNNEKLSDKKRSDIKLTDKKRSDEKLTDKERSDKEINDKVRSDEKKWTDEEISPSVKIDGITTLPAWWYKIMHSLHHQSLKEKTSGSHHEGLRQRNPRLSIPRNHHRLWCNLYWLV